MTGATGFLGRHLLLAFLKAGKEMVLLIRARTQEEASNRVGRILLEIASPGGPPLNGKVRICLGSLSEPDLALSPEHSELVLSTCDEFLHCGASVRLDLSLGEARAVNVNGTVAMLGLARARQRRAGLSRFDYVSTAFVAGNRRDLVREEELDGRLGHKNNYERSKFEAETAVRRARPEIPVTIYRPSVIVGNSSTGETSSFKMIYWPAMVYAMGVWRTCPGYPETSLDLVPVDFIRDVILELRSRPESLGHCFHLTAGPRGSITVAQTVKLLREILPESRPVRFVDPVWYMRTIHPLLKHLSFGRLRRLVRAGESYVPYLMHNPQFDNSGMMGFLSDSGIVVPDVRAYLHQLFRYCIATRWGEAKSGSEAQGREKWS